MIQRCNLTGVGIRHPLARDAGRHRPQRGVRWCRKWQKVPDAHGERTTVGKHPIGGHRDSDTAEPVPVVARLGAVRGIASVTRLGQAGRDRGDDRFTEATPARPGKRGRRILPASAGLSLVSYRIGVGAWPFWTTGSGRRARASATR
jgi:hypothetical protein